MPLEGELKRRVERSLNVVDDHGMKGARLLDDGRRLVQRVGQLVARGAVAPETNTPAVELACYALQLPLKTLKTSATGKLGRTNLKERAEQSAEMLVGLMADAGFEAIVDEATQLLVQVHQRYPVTEGARVLADAINLEDFGISGLIVQAIQLARQGSGVLQVADGCEKRDQYGYWEARLKEGFHFELSRQIARRRLEGARQSAALLLQELKEDGAL